MDYFTHIFRLPGIRLCIRWCMRATLAYFLLGCANQIAPTGGEIERIPPSLVQTNPETQTLFFEGNQVKIYFGEAVKKPTYNKEIFVSPLLSSRPNIIQSDNGKRIRLKFQEALLPNTTYVITVNEVADVQEGTPMSNPYTFAFSTGGQLDSMEVEGQVQSPVLGKGQEEMMLMLFPADSVEENDIFRKRPAYISKTDSSGNFLFKYLRKIPYKIYGVVDDDQSNTFSQPKEVLALTPDPLITFEDTTQRPRVTLYSFAPDDIAPVLRKVVWINDSVMTVQFSERMLMDSLQLAMTDTLGENRQVISRYSYGGGQDFEIYMEVPRKKEVFSFLEVSHLVDSLGNREDSIMFIRPGRNREKKNPLLRPPAYNFETEQMEFFTTLILDPPDSNLIFLTDTITQIPPDSVEAPPLIDPPVAPSKKFPYRNKVPADFVVNGFEVQVIPRATPKPKAPYLLHIRGEYFGEADTSYQYTLRWPNIEEYGTFSGVVKVPDYEGAVVLQLMQKDKMVRQSYDTTFSYRFLSPDTYRLRIILDADSNQCWTPGSISEYRMPEKIFESPVETSIRANWDVEEAIIDVNPNLQIQQRIAIADTASLPPPTGKKRRNAPNRRGQND